jgi:hypothetical protein
MKPGEIRGLLKPPEGNIGRENGRRTRADQTHMCNAGEKGKTTFVGLRAQFAWARSAINEAEFFQTS